MVTFKKKKRREDKDGGGGDGGVSVKMDQVTGCTVG